MADPKMEAMEKALDALTDALTDSLTNGKHGAAARAAVLTLYREALEDARRWEAATREACEIIEMGDLRLLASDGPAGNQPPELSLSEWRRLYVVLDKARRKARAAMATDAPTEDDCGHGAFNPGCDLCDRHRAEFRDAPITGGREMRKLTEAEVAAMWLWGDEYSKQSLSAIDWFRTLTTSRRDLIKRFLKELAEARS